MRRAVAASRLRPFGVTELSPVELDVHHLTGAVLILGDLEGTGHAGREQQLSHPGVVAPEGGDLQLLELGGEEGLGGLDRDQPVDVGVAGLEDRLIRCAQHLVELLPRTYPDDLDGDVGSHLAAREPDHPLGQVDDADGYPHLQHEDLPTLGQGRGLQHQLHRLLDAHEEPGHPGIGHRDRATLGDLPGEGGDDAAPAAQYVPEANGAVGGARGGVGQERLLGQPLRRAHHAGRADRLVGRDLHEAGGAHGHRGIDDVEGAQHVGLRRLERMLLEHRHVLVGSGMEDDLGPEALERLEDGAPVGDVDERLVAGTGHRGRRIVQMGLIVVEEHQQLGLQARDLPADL